LFFVIYNIEAGKKAVSLRLLKFTLLCFALLCFIVFEISRGFQHRTFPIDQQELLFSNSRSAIVFTNIDLWPDSLAVCCTVHNVTIVNFLRESETTYCNGEVTNTSEYNSKVHISNSLKIKTGRRYSTRICSAPKTLCFARPK